MFQRLDPEDSPKMRKTDRVFVLEPIEGKNITSTMGVVDHRLFKGGNALHAIQDSQTTLWGLAYENGNVPQPLKQRFTTFKTLQDFVKTYFGRRGIAIKEIRD